MRVEGEGSECAWKEEVTEVSQYLWPHLFRRLYHI